MTNIYVTSLEDNAGKTTLCIGLMSHFRSLQKKVGYLKPVASGTTPDADCVLMKDAFGLPEAADKLCPFPPQSDGKDLAAKVAAYLKEAGAGKDVTIIEGINLSNDGAASAEIAKSSGARTIAVIGYRDGLSLQGAVDKLKPLGPLAGLVFNKVPARKIPVVKQEMTAKLAASKIDILGFVPENRTLLSPSVGQLAEALSGKILNDAEASGEIVENMMVGAMTVGSALNYFELKANKAVITRGDRPDIQHAALATSTKCLILTGNKMPVTRIMTLAKEKRIPLILVEQETLAVIEKLSGLPYPSSIWNRSKVETVGDLVFRNLNLAKLQ